MRANLICVMAAALVAGLCLVPVLSNAADLAVPRPDGICPPYELSSRDLLVRRAALYGIRGHFDVMDPDLIRIYLEGAWKSNADDYALSEEAKEINTALLSEGSYYMISLKYLVISGGANWPTDKAAASYDRESLDKIEELLVAWPQTVLSPDGDVLALLEQVDAINALTEGFLSVPPELDGFSRLLSVVDQIISKRPLPPGS